MGQLQVPGQLSPDQILTPSLASYVTSGNLLDPYRTLLLIWKMVSLIFTFKGGYED